MKRVRQFVGFSAVVGAFAERMKFSAMLIFPAVWLALVYLPICHMTWGGTQSAATTSSPLAVCCAPR